MAKEIERKFLLADGASIPIPAKYERFQIKQGYLLAEKGKQIRVRLTKTKAVITIKYTANIVRDEYEYEIPMKDGKEIYSKCELKIEKKRLSFSRDNAHFDVDSFTNGIQFVEVEFQSLKDMKKWVKPQWLGKEITKDKKYSNIILAKQLSV
jgi:adenylate cyclase